MTIVIHDIASGLMAGLLSVFLVLYAFQPSRPYPSWVLEPAERPWLFVVIAIGLVYLVKWDYAVGVLALLFVLAVVFDIILLTSPSININEKTESLYTPSISLIPAVSKLQKEQFDNQKVVPVVLPKDEQVSKRWSVSLKPTPHELKANDYVDMNDAHGQASRSGIPLSNSMLEASNTYPLFNL